MADKFKQIYEYYSPRAEAPLEYRACPHCVSELQPQKFERHRRSVCPECGFIHYRNPAPTVVVLVEDQGRVLLGRRGVPPGKGQWALPSGYIEYEDDFLSTAVTEIKEETGLEIMVTAILNVLSSFVSPEFHFIAIYLSAQVIGGELRAADDLEEAAWFALDEPMPEMGFQEDFDAIRSYARGAAGLPVEPLQATT